MMQVRKRPSGAKEIHDNLLGAAATN